MYTSKTEDATSIWILTAEDSHAEFKFLDSKYQIDHFDNFESLCTRAREGHSDKPDILIFDIKGCEFPQTEQYEHAAKLVNPTALLFTSDHDRLDTVREAYKIGAKDFIVRPISQNVLTVKLERIITSAIKRNKLLDGLTIDPAFRKMSSKMGQAVTFTSKEFQIFIALCESQNLTCQRKKLIRKVWSDTKVCNKAFDVHLFNLRKKLLPFNLSVQFERPEHYSIRRAERSQNTGDSKNTDYYTDRRRSS